MTNKRSASLKFMKYWGKKSPTVWGSLIDKYSNEGDVVFDPMAGSGTTYFSTENRRIILRDINNFSIFTFNASNFFETEKIRAEMSAILSSIRKLKIYRDVWVNAAQSPKEVVSKKVDGNLIYNWDQEKKEFFETDWCGKYKSVIWNVNFDDLFEEDTATKLSKEFGKKFQDIWDNEQLIVLDALFKKIQSIKDVSVKNSMFLGFLKVLHLSHKGNAYRSSRPTASGWGRPAFMNLKKRILVNPLILFERSLFGMQGLYKFASKKSVEIQKSNIFDLKPTGEKVKLIITDPPYEDLVQYDELSQVWNVWLNKFKNIPQQRAEKINEQIFSKIIDSVFKLGNELDGGGKIILSINHNSKDLVSVIKKIGEQNSFVLQKTEKYKIDRSSESNVGKVNWHTYDSYLIFGKE